MKKKKKKEKKAKEEPKVLKVYRVHAYKRPIQAKPKAVKKAKKGDPPVFTGDAPLVSGHEVIRLVAAYTEQEAAAFVNAVDHEVHSVSEALSGIEVAGSKSGKNKKVAKSRKAKPVKKAKAKKSKADAVDSYKSGKSEDEL